MSAIGTPVDDPMVKYRIELWKQDPYACQNFEDLVLFLRHLARDQFYSQSSCIRLDLCVSRLEAFATVLNIHTPVSTNGSAHTIPNSELDPVWRGVNIVISRNLSSHKLTEQAIDTIWSILDLLPNFTTLLEIWPSAKCDNVWKAVDHETKLLAVAFGNCCWNSAGSGQNAPQSSLYGDLGASGNSFFHFPTSLLLKYRTRQNSRAFRKAESELFRHTASFMRRFQGIPKLSASANPTVLTSSSLPSNNSMVDNTSSTTHILHLIPHRRNVAYFDSEWYLYELTKLLIRGADSRTDTPCVGLFGLSGTGKTQHALEFAYRSRIDFDYIFWIDASSRSKTATSISDIANSVCPRPVGDANIEFAHFLNSTNARWLLVLDDVEDVDSISSNVAWPDRSGHNGAVLITSRERINHPPWLTQRVLVESLSPQMGRDFLLDLVARDGGDVTSEEQRRAAMTVSTHTGGLPLALTMVAQYCYTRQLSLSEVNQQILRREPESWLPDRFDLPPGLRLLLTSTIQQMDSSPRRLINIISLWNDIPEFVLLTKTKSQYLDFVDHQSLLAAFAPLSRYCLVERVREHLHTHRVIQMLTLQDLVKNEPEMTGAMEFALETLVLNIMLPAFAECIPHVLVLAEIYRLHQPRLHLTPSVLSNMCAAGVRLFEHGVIEPAAALLNMLEKIIDESPETTDLYPRARTHLALAQVVDSIGISGRSVALVRRQAAIEIVLHLCYDTTKDSDETKRLLCAACVEMARSFLDLDQVAAAEDILHQAFSQLQELDKGTTFPRDYANCYDALSQLFAAREEWDQALDCRHRSLELVSLDDPLALLYELQLAHLLIQVDRLDDAQTHLHGVLEVHQVHGVFNLHAVEAGISLGILQLERGEEDRAKEQIMRYLRVLEILDVGKERVARAKFYLSLTLADTTESSEAEQHQHEAQSTFDWLDDIYDVFQHQDQRRYASNYKLLVPSYMRYPKKHLRAIQCPTVKRFVNSSVVREHRDSTTPDWSYLAFREAPASNQSGWSNTLQPLEGSSHPTFAVSDTRRSVGKDLALPFNVTLDSTDRFQPTVVDRSSLADVANQVLRRTLEATADAGAGSIPQSQLNVAIGAIVCTGTFAAGALAVAAKSAHNGVVANRIAQRKFEFDKKVHDLKEARRQKAPARNNSTGNDSDSDIDNNSHRKSSQSRASIAGSSNTMRSANRSKDTTSVTLAIRTKPMKCQTSQPDRARDSEHPETPTIDGLAYVSNAVEADTSGDGKCNAAMADARGLSSHGDEEKPDDTPNDGEAKGKTSEQDPKMNNTSEVKHPVSSSQGPHHSLSDVTTQPDGNNTAQKNRESLAIENTPPEATSSVEEPKGTDSLENAETLRGGTHMNGKNNNRIADTVNIRVSLEELAKIHPPSSVLEPKDRLETHDEHQTASNDIKQSSSSLKVDNVRRHEEELKRQRELNARLEQARIEDADRRQFQTQKNIGASCTKEDGRQGLHSGIAKILPRKFRSKALKAETPVNIDDNIEEHVAERSEPEHPAIKAQKHVAGKASRARASIEEERDTGRFEMDNLGNDGIDH